MHTPKPPNYTNELNYLLSKEFQSILDKLMMAMRVSSSLKMQSLSSQVVKLPFQSPGGVVNRFTGSSDPWFDSQVGARWMEKNRTANFY